MFFSKFLVQSFLSISFIRKTGSEDRKSISILKHTKLDWKNWKTPKVLLCSLSIFSFNLLILSHLQERGKLWIENIHKSLCLPSDIKKAEKRQMFYCFHYQCSRSIFSFSLIYKKEGNYGLKLYINPYAYQVILKKLKNVKYFIVLIFNFLVQSSLKIYINTSAYLSILKSCKTSKMAPLTYEHTAWHTTMNKPYQQIGRYDTKWLFTIKTYS